MNEQNQNEPKTISPGLLTTLIVVILAAAGFFGWNYLQKQKVVTPVVAPTATTEVTPLVTSTTPTTTSDVSTADWKTYTNDTYKISFKYPKDWTLITGKNDSNFTEIVFSNNKVAGTSDFVELKIDATSDKTKVGGHGIFEGMENLKTTQKDVSIGGKIVKAYYFQAGSNYAISLSEGQGFISSPDAKNFYEILYSYTANSDSSFEKTYDQILSTFQFMK